MAEHAQRKPDLEALYLSGADLAEMLDMREAVDCVQEAFLAEAHGQASNHPRIRMRIPESPAARAAGDLRAMLHVLPGTLSARRVLGVKAYVSTPGGARFTVLLFDAVSGRMLSVMEADRLGQVRTGATSGLATRLLAREEASVLAIIGTGWQARSQVEAVCAVRPIREVRAFGRSEERRARFCQEMAERVGVRVVPVESAEEAVRGAHVVCTATTSATPVLLGAWLEPGMHVNAVGSNAPNRRELDEAAVLRATRVVVDDLEQARVECGDIIAVVAQEKMSWEQVSPLAHVVSSHLPWRDFPRDVTLFESQGLATEDLALAAHLLAKARERGLGTPLALCES